MCGGGPLFDGAGGHALGQKKGHLSSGGHITPDPKFPKKSEVEKAIQKRANVGANDGRALFLRF